MTVEYHQVTRLQQARLGGRHVVIDDLYVTMIGARALVQNMLMHRLCLAAWQNVQAAVSERCLGDRQPQADDRASGLERKIVRILVPWLAPGPRILEDELRQETVNIRAECGAHDLLHGGHSQKLEEDWTSVQFKNL